MWCYSKYLGEDIGNNKKSNNLNATHLPQKSLLGPCFITSMIKQNVYSYIYLSSFSTYINERTRDYGCILGMFFWVDLGVGLMHGWMPLFFFGHNGLFLVGYLLYKWICWLIYSWIYICKHLNWNQQLYNEKICEII